MYKRFTFQNIEYIKGFLYYSRGVLPIHAKKYSFTPGHLDSIAVVNFEYFLGKRVYIVDITEYFNWLQLKERGLKINKLKKLI